MTRDTTEPTLSLSRFRALLDAYGAVEARWPPEDRGPAAALLARSAQARAIHADAAALDERLDEAQAPAPSPALVAAVSALGPAEPVQRTWRVPFMRSGNAQQGAAPLRLAFGGLAAACLLIGFLVGWQVNAPRIERTVATAPATFDFDEPTDDTAFGPLAALDDGWLEEGPFADDEATNGFTDLPLQ